MKPITNIIVFVTLVMVVGNAHADDGSKSKSQLALLIEEQGCNVDNEIILAILCGDSGESADTLTTLCGMSTDSCGLVGFSMVSVADTSSSTDVYDPASSEADVINPPGASFQSECCHPSVDSAERKENRMNYITGSSSNMAFLADQSMVVPDSTIMALQEQYFQLGCAEESNLAPVCKELPYAQHLVNNQGSLTQGY